MVHDGPRSFREGVGLDAALDEVDGERGPDEALERRIAEDSALDSAEGKIRMGGASNHPAERSGHGRGMLGLALDGLVNGIVSALGMAMLVKGRP